MLAAQARLPLGMPFRPRARNVRRPFMPPRNGGPYRLPHDVRDRLVAALAPFRNRDAAFALAAFLARFWSMPARILDAFPIDRRELAGREDLGLTEDRVRGAIRVLEEVGFLDRAIPPSGSRYRATEEGLHRKPILFVFGSDYAPAFIAANARAAAARGARSGERRVITPSNASRPSTARFEARPLNSPKSTSEAESSVIMGEVRKCGIQPKAFEPNSKLESALERLGKGVFGKAEAVEGRAELDSDP